MLELTVSRERWPMKAAFRISGHTFTHFDVVDLDAPMLLASDRTPSAIYLHGMVQCPEDWGFPPMRA